MLRQSAHGDGRNTRPELRIKQKSGSYRNRAGHRTAAEWQLRWYIDPVSRIFRTRFPADIRRFLGQAYNDIMIFINMAMQEDDSSECKISICLIDALKLSSHRGPCLTSHFDARKPIFHPILHSFKPQT